MKATAQKARKELAETGQTAAQQLKAVLVMLPELGDLKKEADRMKSEIALARTLRSNDVVQWGQVPKEAIQRLVLCLIMWSKREGHNVLVCAPPQVVRNTNGITPYHKVPLTDLLFWVMAGLLTEEERKVLAGG